MIKIGILIDGFEVRAWQFELLEFIQSHPSLAIEAIIIKNNRPEFNNKNSSLYRISQAIDRKIFKTKEQLFEVKDISFFKNKYDCYYINGEEKRFSYRFLESDLNRIRELELDLLIRFGFGILRGGILNAAKNGVWSLHHGDNRINRGGPPAFWEVVNQEPVTGITLQRLSENLDGGTVIKRSFIKTNITSFHRNKTEAFRAGIELFEIALEELIEDKVQPFKQNSGLDFYSHPLYKDPSNLTSIKIIFNFWLRRLKEFLNEKRNSPQWFLLYKFHRQKNIEKSVFRYKKLYPPDGYDWADPFIINENDSFYLFFEELKVDTGKGHISYLHFNSAGNLLTNKGIKVLEESWHLSYPYTFKHDSSFFMLPESANSGDLWLYECIKFPDKWEKKIRFFKNKNIYDASIFFHNGYWYLFGTETLTSKGSRDQYLHIYYSKELFSEAWIPHKGNPVTMDVRGARPAGKIFEKNGRLYRPSQIGAPKYGYAIQINEILSLTPTEFKEKKVDEILPKWGKNLYATHTFNHSSGFSVIDAQGNF